MTAMELDRQSIERRDFPIGRRGYDPAAVDAHLRALAAEVDELRRAADSRGGETLGSAAGTRVQSILEAAEATAADIERRAADDAGRVREEADLDAEQTREDAVAQARAHVEAVARATSVLLGRVESLDGEVGTLTQSVRAAADRLAADVAAVERNMAELYDAATGRGDAGRAPGSEGVATGAGALSAPAAPAQYPAAGRAPAPTPAPALTPTPTPTPVPVQAAMPAQIPTSAPPPEPALPEAEPTLPAPQGADAGAANGGDLDSARLVALNMALNGESREQTESYLAENFRLTDQRKLVDEVYAAIEG